MVTTNLSLDLPIVGVTLGPTYATMLNEAFELIDEHDHTSGKGLRIVPGAININADLTFGSNNATNVKSVRLINNASALATGSDIRCLYVTGNNLYYNNSSGTAVQLTNGTSINIGNVVSNAFSYKEVTSNLVLASGDGYTYLAVATNAARSITLPNASAVSAGRYYAIKDITGSSESNNITVIRGTSGDTIDGVAASKVFARAYGSWILTSDGVSNWSIFNSELDNALSSITLGSTAATTGNVRVPNNTTIIAARNAANNANLSILATNSSNQLLLGNSTGATVMQGQLQSGTAGNFVLSGGSTDWLTFSSNRTKTVRQQIPGNFQATTQSQLSGVNQGGITMTTVGTGGYVTIRNPIQGALLASVELRWIVSDSHAGGQPQHMPTMQVKRQLVSSTSADMLSSGGELDISTAASGVDWYSTGAIQSYTYTCDQNNTIDTSTYYYYVILLDEYGTNSVAASTRWISLTMNYTTIPSMQL